MTKNEAIAATTNPVFSLSIPIETLQPLVESILESTGCVPGWPIGRVALNEFEAADCVGVKAHVLRDARLRLKLSHTLVGRTVAYTPTQLALALQKMTLNP